MTLTQIKMCIHDWTTGFWRQILVWTQSHVDVFVSIFVMRCHVSEQQAPLQLINSFSNLVTSFSYLIVYQHAKLFIYLLLFCSFLVWGRRFNHYKGLMFGWGQVLRKQFYVLEKTFNEETLWLWDDCSGCGGGGGGVLQYC